jgi:RNA polymerase-binding transcription factor DksA
MLTMNQRSIIEVRLLEEREEAMEALARFAEDNEVPFNDQAGEMTSYRLHLADIGTEAMEQEKQMLFASNEGRRLYDTLDALRRLYDDPEAFGTCEGCGASIGFERLELVPAARTCAGCQRAQEA